MKKTKKNKILKSGNFIEKKNKEQEKKKIFISVFIAVIMISSILAVTLSGGNSETKRFNNFKFTRTEQGVWLTKISGTQYSFQMLPANLIYYFASLNNITIEDRKYTDNEIIKLSEQLKEYELIKKIGNTSTILLTTNIDSLINTIGESNLEITQSDYYLIASIENSKYVLSDLLNEQEKLSYVGSFYNKTTKEKIKESQVLSGFLNMKKISCENSDVNTLVIVFDPTTENQQQEITLDLNQNCAIISFSSTNKLSYINEYLLYSLLGIFKEE